MLYEKHIFICTNQREPGARVCCSETTGMALVAAFKKEVKERGLQVKVRAQRAGCLDICEHGPNVVVYPAGVFYGNVQLEDVNVIMEEHIIGNKPVERLRLKFPPRT